MEVVTFNAGRGNEVGLLQNGCVLFITRAAPEPVRDVPPAVASPPYNGFVRLMN